MKKSWVLYRIKKWLKIKSRQECPFAVLKATLCGNTLCGNTPNEENYQKKCFALFGKVGVDAFIEMYHGNFYGYCPCDLFGNEKVGAMMQQLVDKNRKKKGRNKK